MWYQIQLKVSMSNIESNIIKYFKGVIKDNYMQIYIIRR